MRKKDDRAPCIAVLGTGSDVGKSIIVTALCRYYKNKGIRVVPYKAQNMSNNSGVTPDGMEMGRAQIVQAEAAGLPPHVDMNPILLKPTAETGAQVVLMGKVLEESTAAEYHNKKKTLFSAACAALDRLREEYELVVIEGAGSCAEVNLMEHDIVNFHTASYAEAHVIVVADIHKGGVFAQIVGTMECVGKAERDMIKGFIINRFRGDISLFKDGVEWIENRTSKNVFGVLPWFNHIKIEAEDSVVIEQSETVLPADMDGPAIAVIRLPHISNFTDFDPLADIDGLSLYFVEKARELSGFSAVIIPGSKNTKYDLNWLYETGWAEIIAGYVENGGNVLGICGGFQILGEKINDPEGLDGRAGTAEGLGLLPVVTTLKSPKTTTLTGFSWDGVRGRGYEIHMGQTERSGGKPVFHVEMRNGSECDTYDGSVSADSKIMGTYMHGMFDSPGITRLWLESVGLGSLNVPDAAGLEARDREYDLLAEHFEENIDVSAIDGLIF